MFSIMDGKNATMTECITAILDYIYIYNDMCEVNGPKCKSRWE